MCDFLKSEVICLSVFYLRKVLSLILNALSIRKVMCISWSFLDEIFNLYLMSVIRLECIFTEKRICFYIQHFPTQAFYSVFTIFTFYWKRKEQSFCSFITKLKPLEMVVSGSISRLSVFSGCAYLQVVGK